MEMESFWRKCTTCKGPIGYKKKYWVCSVSSCNRPRTNLVFCNLSCFDAHVPVLNHRDAGAFERIAPSESEAKALEQAGKDPREATQAKLPPGTKKEILVVASKVKDFIRSEAGMNTSQSVMDILSDELRKLADQAIQQAKNDNRKTVMDRDLVHVSSFRRNSY